MTAGSAIGGEYRSAVMEWVDELAEDQEMERHVDGRGYRRARVQASV